MKVIRTVSEWSIQKWDFETLGDMTIDVQGNSGASVRKRREDNVQEDRENVKQTVIGT